CSLRRHRRNVLWNRKVRDGGGACARQSSGLPGKNSGVDRRTPWQQRMCLRWPAIECKRAELRVGIDGVARTGEITGAVIAREIVTAGKRRTPERAQIAADAAIDLIGYYCRLVA